MSKRSLHVPRFLRFGRSRSQEPLQAECSNATGVTSVPSSEVGTSQQAQGGPDAAQSISSGSANQLTYPVPSPSPMHSASSYQMTDFNPPQNQEQSTVPQWAPARGPQPLSPSQQLIPPLQPHLPQPHDGNPGPWNAVLNIHESRNVSVPGSGNYVNYTNTLVNTSNKFMAELLEKAIPGAAFDSSARDPPPRCHPGTRLAILERCLEFIANAIAEKKVRWVVGAAGVGKSAIMQNVADSHFVSDSPGASIFFSINGRNDGTRAIITLAYQLAAKCKPYRVLIESEITRDPSILQSSLSVQFKKFLIEPFIHHPELNSLGHVLIIVDGLDECDKSHTQRELLRLISDLCSTYPSSPIVWIIASRPEPHITSFFAQNHVKAVYEKEEILVDSDEARRDVEKYLRNELTSIQIEFSLNPQSQWPREPDLWKLASAAGGLFVYADTVIKYVGDRTFGNPTSQLNDVLKVIDAHPLRGVPREEHPMARLDELYAQILSKIPEKIMVNTRKILLALVLDSRKHWSRSFLVLCNWLGMTCDDAYAALRHLLSVLTVPERDKAHEFVLQCFHKSFIDYISDFSRSGLFSDIEHEAHHLEVQCTFRILEQAPDGIDFGDTNYVIHNPDFGRVGVLARGPGTGGNILPTWLVDEEQDNFTRLEMYKLSAGNVVEGIRNEKSAFCTEFCIRLVTARWRSHNFEHFPYEALENLVFERSRRHEFIEHGILKQIPVKAFLYTNVVYGARLQFRCLTTTVANPSDPLKSSCRHSRTHNWDQSKDENWRTEYKMSDVKCRSCCQRLEAQLEKWKTRSPDHLVTVLFTSTYTSFVEFQFVDPDDGVSEWTYWFMYHILEEEQKFLGSPM